MKQKVKNTSIQVYRQLKREGKISSMQFEIINYILYTGNSPLTRREIEEGLGMRGSSVAGRVNELIDKEYLRLSANRKCRIEASSCKVETVFVEIEKQITIF